MARSTGNAVVFGGTLAIIGACTGLAGLDDLQFGTQSVGGSGGAGVTSGMGAGTATSTGPSMGIGGGGAGFSTGCDGAPNDRIDVDPVRLNTESAHRDLDIVALDDVYGVVRYVPVLEGGGLAFTIVGRDGLARGSQVLQPDELDNQDANVAASASHFAVPAMNNDSIDVHLFPPDGSAGDVVSIPLASFSLQALATGAPGGFLLTYRDNQQPDGLGVYARFISDVTMDAGPASLVPAGNDITCCSERYWTVGRLADGSYGALWEVQAQGGRYSAFDGGGLPLAVASPLPSLNDMPRFAARLGNDLFVGSCTFGVVASPGGGVGPSATISGDFQCAIGSNGEVLRMAEIVGGSLVWSELDPVSGTKSQLLSAPVATSTVLRLEMAWDGDGFGVVWIDDGDIMFTRIAVCE